MSLSVGFSKAEASFLKILGISTRVQGKASGHIVSMTNNALRTGMYDVYCDSGRSLQERQNAQLNLAKRYVSMSRVHRRISHDVSGQENALCQGVRARDGKCVISWVSECHNLIAVAGLV
jgi:hypothetical protein